MSDPTPFQPDATPASRPDPGLPGSKPPSPPDPAPSGSKAPSPPAASGPALPRRWPGPTRPAAVAVLVTAGVIGIVTAVCVPLDRPGIGWVGTGLAAAGGLAAIDRSWDIRRLAWTLGALALLAVGAIRAAGWLFALCVPTAGVAAALAITTGTSVRGMAAGVAAVPAAVVRAIPWAARTARPAWSRLSASTNDAARKGPGISPGERAATAPAVRILAVGAISIGLLWVFGALFASADAAFADLLDNLTPPADPDQVSQRLFLFTFGALGLLGAAYLLTAPPDLAGIEAPAPRPVHRWEWAVPVALLDLLFAAFVLVQVTVLFGGGQHVLDEHGPTYAEYARSGFWQLLTVTVLTLPVLGIAARRAPRAQHADRTLIRVLLGSLAGLTLVIVASALYRMNLYQQAYGFTRLRLLVSACELWLGAVFAMVLAAGVRLRARWLAQAVAGSAAATLLGLAVLNPDRFIADQNIDRYERIDRIDVYYLYRLSADAAPALDRLPYPLRDCALSKIASDLAASPADWRGANLGREQARDIVGDRPVRPDWTLCKG
jgi:Domain of unknown function (DUF4153)